MNLWPLPCQSAGELVEEAILGLRPGAFGAVWLLLTALQRRIIVPAARLSFAPLAAFATSPGLAPAIGLLMAAGLGNAWTAGIDGLLIDTAPPDLRNRAPALAGAGIMFTQGAGFALWSVARLSQAGPADW